MNDTVRLAVEAGASAQAVRCDVTVEPMVRSAVAAAANEGGRLDVAVNSAGNDGSAALATDEWTSEMLDEMLASNVRGMFPFYEARTGAHAPAGSARLSTRL